MTVQPLTVEQIYDWIAALRLYCLTSSTENFRRPEKLAARYAYPVGTKLLETYTWFPVKDDFRFTRDNMLHSCRLILDDYAKNLIFQATEQEKEKYPNDSLDEKSKEIGDNLRNDLNSHILSYHNLTRNFLYFVRQLEKLLLGLEENNAELWIHFALLIEMLNQILILETPEANKQSEPNKENLREYAQHHVRTQNNIPNNQSTTQYVASETSKICNKFHNSATLNFNYAKKSLIKSLLTEVNK